MRSSGGLICGMLVLTALFGCTLPKGGGTASSVGYLGDRATVALQEVVVSMPAVGGTRYLNLHVALSAAINPLKASSYTPNDVHSLIRRLEARIDARLVQTLLEMGELRVTELAKLEGKVREEAQSVVDLEWADWTHGDEYEVRVVVVSLYLTDGSVARQPTPSRYRW